MKYMNFSIRTAAPNPLGLSPRVLAVIGYAFDQALTVPCICNLRIDDNVIGVLKTTIDGVDVTLATVDEIEEILDRVATLLRLSPADALTATQMFFDKLYQHVRQEVVCL